jgi:hypothetical protein
MDHYTIFGGAFLLALPIVVIAIVVINMALRRRSQHPRSSLLVIVGLLLLVANALVADPLRTYFRISVPSDGNPVTVAWHLALLNIVSYGLNVAGIAFLAAAVFANRAPASGKV